MAAKEPDVSVVIVSYNGKVMLRECLRSVFDETRGASCEVIVSDNGSQDGSTEMVKEYFPSVVLIENGDNLGFAKANNVAFLHCRGRYVLLLNPDALVLSGAIERLVRFMDSTPVAAAAGARLYNEDGSLQFSIRKFPTLLGQMAESFFLHELFPRMSRFGEIIKDPKAYERQGEVEWVTGAALMLRREALEDVGLLDERFFMYSEEKDWCFRARKKGWKIYFTPDARFVHVHGDSGTNPLLYSYLVRSKLSLVKKHYSYAEGLLVVLLVRVGLGLRVCVWLALSLLNGFRSEKAVGRFRASWAGFIGSMGRGAGSR